MATTVFLTDDVATTHRGTNTAKLDTTAVGWEPYSTSTSRGAGVVAVETSTVAGATNGVEVTNGVSGTTLEWISPPIDADVTISGTITGNIWAAESSMNANVAINFRVHKMSATDGALTEIVKSARVTEVAVTTRAVNNFTATPTSTAMTKGDRFRITIFGDDAGTMGSGFTFFASYNGTTAAADGDTFITFNETFGFQTTDPTGTTIYLTNTASDVSTADVDQEAWTSRGGSATTAASDPPGAGWLAPFQAASTPGGTAVSWFTKPLQAFTLAGLVKCNIRSAVGTINVNASLGVEVARVDGDGTNATVWGYANRDANPIRGGAGEIHTTQEAYTVYVSGDDLALSDGQRLRIRLFSDDCADIAHSGSNVELWYNGPTGGASGDTFLIFGQTLAEFSTTVNPPRVQTAILQAVQRAWTY